MFVFGKKQALGPKDTFYPGSRPPCSISTPYAEGRWVHRPFQSPDSVASLHEQARYKCGQYWSDSRVLEHFLCGHRSKEDLDVTTTIMQWMWVPEMCSLPQSNIQLQHLIKNFLSKAQGTSFVFLGDSIMEEQFISIRCLLGEHVEKEASNYFVASSNISFTFEKNVLLINTATQRVDDPLRRDLPYSSRGNDSLPPTIKSKSYLQDLEKANLEDEKTWENSTQFKSSPSFGHLIRGSNVTLVFSQGSHWHGNLDNYIMMVKDVLKYLQANFGGSRILFRAIGHGHHGCTTPGIHLEPKTPRKPDPQEKLDVIRDMSKYNWRMFPHWNDIWKYEIDALQDHRIHFMDISPMTQRRADAHVGFRWEQDCLHWCLPGVIDYWNYLLFSIITHEKLKVRGAHAAS